MKYSLNDLRTLYTAYYYELPADHNKYQESFDEFMEWLGSHSPEENKEFLNACKGK